MDDLYHTDLYAWSQRQAAVLRSLANRRDLPNELDLEHVAEEIEDVGGSQLSSVRSFIRLMFIHLMKAASSPQAYPVERWADEVVRFQGDMLERLSPSMHQLIDINDLWRRARRETKASLELFGETIKADLPTQCPFALSDLVEAPLDIRQALRRLNAELPERARVD